MTKTDTFNFSEVPSWYALCLNHECPMREDCLRYLAGTHAPDSLETAVCVMPQTLKEGKCNLFDEKKVVTWAAGFSHLYDRVLKDDFTSMPTIRPNWPVRESAWRQVLLSVSARRASALA